MSETNTRFTDGKGNQWTIDIDFTVVRRVKTGCGVDLMHAIPRAREDESSAEEPLIVQLDFDLVMFLDVLYWVLHPQLEDKNIDAKQFGEECLTPLVYPSAARAFWGAYSDFFLEIGWKHVSEAILKQQEVMPEIRNRATAQFEEAALLTLNAFDKNSEHVMEGLRKAAGKAG